MAKTRGKDYLGIKERLGKATPRDIIITEIFVLPIIFTITMLTMGVMIALISLILTILASFTAIHFHRYMTTSIKNMLLSKALETGVPLYIENILITYSTISYLSILLTPIGLYLVIYVLRLLNFPLYISSILISLIALMPILIMYISYMSIVATVKVRAGKIEDEIPYFPVIIRILDLALVPFDRALLFLKRSWLRSIAFEVSIAEKMAKFTGITLQEAFYRHIARVNKRLADMVKALIEEFETTGRVTKVSEVLYDMEIVALERRIMKVADNIDFISAIVSSALGLIASTLFVLLIFMPMSFLQVVFVLGGIPVLIVAVTSLPWYFTMPQIVRDYVPKKKIIISITVGLIASILMNYMLKLDIYDALPLMLAITVTPASILTAIHLFNAKRAEAELPLILRSLSERVSLGEDPIHVLRELSERARSRYTRYALTLIARSVEAGIPAPVAFASPLLSFAYDTLGGILIEGYATSKGLEVLANTISKIISMKQTVSIARTSMLVSILMTIVIVLVAYVISGVVVEMSQVLPTMGAQIIMLSYDTINAMKTSLMILPLAIVVSMGAASGCFTSSLPLFMATEYLTYVFIVYQPYISKMFISAVGGITPTTP